MNRLKIYFLVSALYITSCTTHVSKSVVIYSNDFEKGDISNISNGIIGSFNGSAVLGQYNNGYFTLNLDNIPSHNAITVSFDLYIHDTWDGNNAAPDGPDIWQMTADGSSYIYTTFSNTPCTAGDICAPQSYPFDYPNNYNNPKSGAYRTDLPGVCLKQNIPNWTTQYKIVKTFKHTGGTLTLQCLDKLVQTNTANPKCDESWSVDNILIQAINL